MRRSILFRSRSLSFFLATSPRGLLSTSATPAFSMSAGRQLNVEEILSD
jgi:hypothetical protein